MTRIGIILGSTRPGRNGEQVAAWVLQQAQRRTDAEFDIIDLREHPLPHLDEAMPPSFGQYQNQHTKDWAQTIAAYDGFVFITPEYNHSITSALKAALDAVFAEWGNKAAGFVSYGAHGGVRAAEHLRQIAGELRMADVRTQVVLNLATEFKNYREFQPGEYNLPILNTMLDEVIAWSDALAPLRTASSTAAA